MHTRLLRTLSIAALAVAATASVARSAQAQEWNITDLGTLGGSFSMATDINDAGQIVGSSGLANGNTNAFLYSNGSMVDLGTLGGANSFATAINNSGQVVGISGTATAGDNRLFLYSNGSMKDPTGLSGATGTPAINDRGQIVFTRHTDPFVETIVTGYVYNKGTVTTLPLGMVVGINNSGTIAAINGWDNFPHAVIYRNGTVTNLPGDGPLATGINDAGSVVGRFPSNTNGPGSHEVVYHAFVFGKGQLTDLFPSDATASFANAINNRGQIVGSRNGDGFLYQNGKVINLDSLQSVIAAGWTDLVPNSINDLGQIVGFGLHNGIEEAFLLIDPPVGSIGSVPEPATWAMTMIGLLVAWFLRSRRHIIGTRKIAAHGAGLLPCPA